MYQIKGSNDTSSQETPESPEINKIQLTMKRKNSIWKEKKKIEFTGDMIYSVINDYIILDKIGSGSQGTVYLAYNLKNEKQYAIKIIKGNTIRSYKHKQNALMQEIAIMKNIICPNIAKLYRSNRRYK